MDKKEKRSETRLREKDPVSVTVLSAPDVPGIVKKVLKCTTSDLSYGGLKISVPVPVPVGSMLELRVAFKRPGRGFVHFGWVVWGRKPPGSGKCTLGIRLSDTPPGKLAEWKKLISGKLVQRRSPLPSRGRVR